MSDLYHQDYLYILVFFAAAFIFGIFGIIFTNFLGPKKPNQEKNSSYESGEEPLKDSRIQFNPAYFIIALIFLLFEVEILFLFPWALIFDNEILNTSSGGAWSCLTLIEMFIFIFILILGLAFVWKKGFLNWQKPKPIINEFKSPVPSELYDKINNS